MLWYYINKSKKKGYAINIMINEWVANEFKTLNLYSKRLEERFKITMSFLSDQPDKSIWLASGSRANAKAVYRMLSNEDCDKTNILSAHRDAVGERCTDHQILLAIQDTMSVNYNTHKKTEGLGYNCEQTLGINVHSGILTDISGVPLGILAQSITTRSEEDINRLKAMTPREKQLRPIDEKESNRWLETMKIMSANAPEGVELIHIADREADIYELFALAQRIGEKFIIRALHDRLDIDNMHIKYELQNSTPIGTIRVTIPQNHDKKVKEREAELIIQYQCYDIKRPQIQSNNTGLEASLKLTLIRVFEVSPPEGVEAIEWFLMTNLEIQNINDVINVVKYYKQRWKIERFHFVLKSGCKIENIQQRSVEKIDIMILMYSIIAIHIMQITFLARTAPDTSCDLIFSELEWKTLYRAANHTQSEPAHPPTISEAVLMLAKLGGFVGAKSDGYPGLKVIWIGLSKLLLLVFYRDYL